MIYSGIFDNFELSSDGGLSRLSLINVRRRDFQEDENTNYYEMPGTFFVINYDHIVNLNIDYMQL